MKGQGNKDATSNLKRPREPPKKPLSAYNIYFKEERTRLLESHASGTSPPDFEANLRDSLEAGKTRKSAALFQAASRTIANRWKTMSPEERLPYEKLAKVETEKYDALKEEYEGERLEQMLLHERSKKPRAREGPESARGDTASQPSSQAMPFPTSDSAASAVAARPNQPEERKSQGDDFLHTAGLGSSSLRGRHFQAWANHDAGQPELQHVFPPNVSGQSQAQAPRHHLAGGMVDSASSLRSDFEAQQRFLPAAHSLGQTYSRSLHSSPPQERMAAQSLRASMRQSPPDLLSSLRASMRQPSPDLLSQYYLLESQQQASSIDRLRDLLSQRHPSALGSNPSRPITSPPPGDPLSNPLQYDGTMEQRYDSRGLAPRQQNSQLQSLQRMLAQGTMGGIGRDLLSTALLTRDLPMHSSLSDWQRGHVGQSTSNAAHAAALFSGSTDASTGAGAASLPPQVADSIRLQQLQSLLSQHNTATHGSESSRSSSMPTRGHIGSEASPAIAASRDPSSDISFRRQLNAILSHQTGAPVHDRGPPIHAFLTGDLLSRPSSLDGSTGVGYPSANVATTSSPAESADSIRLRLLASLSGRMRDEEEEEEKDDV